MSKKKLSIALKELKLFTKAYDLVEFGYIKSSDEISPIGGITLQKQRFDHFYAHGNTNGRDVSVLLREFGLSSTTKKSDETYHWVVLKFKLSVEDLPHIFIDAHHADNELYMHLIEVLGSFLHVSDALKPINPSFTSHFHVFAKLQISFLLEKYLHDSVMQTMFEHFQNLSFEMRKNEMLVYSEYSSINYQVLDKMLQAGLWLGEQMEYADAEYHGHRE